MYYCSRSEDGNPYSLEKIHKRMAEILELIPQVALQPQQGPDRMIGKLNYAFPHIELIVEYRALQYKAENPPDPRGERMFCRPGPYIEKAVAKQLAIVLGVHKATVYRALKLVHSKLELKVRSWVTVDEFCWIHELPAGQVHENLTLLVQEKWKTIKEKLKDEKQELKKR